MLIIFKLFILFIPIFRIYSKLEDEICYNTCGLVPEFFPDHPKMAERAYGGAEVAAESFPFIASVIGRLEGCDLFLTCTAAIISDQFIICAAHCIRYPNSWEVDCGLVNGPKEEFDDENIFRPSELNVFVGKNKIPPYNTSGIGVSSISIVSGQPSSTKNKFVDLAILKLKNKITFNKNVRSVCLIDKYDEKRGKLVEFVGFGRTTIKNHFPNIDADLVNYGKLHHLTIALSSRLYCNLRNPGNKDGFICAGSQNKGLSVGDSGGPLIHNHEGRLYLIGVASLGAGSTKLNKNALNKHIYVDTFVKVSTYCTWIKNITQLSCLPIEPIPVQCMDEAENIYQKYVGNY